MKAILLGQVRSSATILGFAAVIVCAGIVGYQLEGSSPRTTLTLVIAVAVIAALNAIDTICRDEEAGWVLPLTTFRLQRWKYTILTAVLLTGYHIVFWALSWTAYSLGARSTGAAALPVGLLLGTSGLVASSSAYGLLFAVLLRRRFAAATAGFLVVALPLIVLTIIHEGTGTLPSERLMKSLAFPAPRPTYLVKHLDLHALYLTVVTLIAAAAGEALLARRS